MTSLGFNHGTRLGLTASCTPASTYGDHVEHRFDVPGHVQITNVGSGSCLSINQIIPWRLPDRWSGKCMDYDFQGNNVYAGSCHDGNNQLWFMADGQIISLRDLKCLDYHPGTENVYMHECHGGNNQKWYWDEDTAQLRSEYDHRCLDVNMQGSNNIYIHPCHSGNNQKFDRSERSDKAFVMGLHLQCSGFEGEDIKLEPIGGENKFHLRSGPHTLPGEFYYDKNKKRLKNLATNKCLMSHERVTVIEESCAESLEQEWDIGHGLQGLADTPIACESNQVISLFEKGHGHIRYKCVHVSGLGACSPGYSTQVDTKVHELENVKALKRMSATCPAGHGLRSIAAEASDKGAWIRLRYECCQISRIPVSVYPMRAYNPDMAHGWEGVYCPSTQDDSGRMQFSQRHSFRPHHGPSGSLTYDKFQGKWCVSGKNCAFSDIVHPLDTMMKTDEWQVVAVSDFDAVFEARGVKPLHSNKKRSPPPLIKFGASDPEYLPECKDESHPGTRTFKLELMNKEAESLDDENACKYVYGKPPKDQAGDGADGMYGWIDDLVSNLGPGQGGVTYKSVKECSDRDIIRELQLAKWSQEHFDKTKYIPLREDAISGLASMVPEVEVAPLGAGVEINDLVEMVGMLILHGAQIKRDQRLSDQEFHFEQAGHDDCNPIQHGFARTFCDLHCIRDAVRKGDDAILRALEEAVEIIGKNTQLLLEHYVGEDSKSGLLEEGQRIKKGIASRMAEMFTMAKEATLEHRASMAATRAINSFTERWRNSTHGAFAMELEELQSTVAELSKRKLSHTDEVQQYALQMANQMGTYLKAQSHVLGIYRHGAEEGKRLQQRLKRVWRSAVSTSAALLEVEEEASEEAMQEFDTMWWDMRRELDSYLGASLDYVHATTAAAQMLRDYSAHCKAGFAELKRSYSHSERAEKKAHRALKKAWTAVTSSLGEMASKVVDGAMFDHLALHDIHSLRLQKSEIKSFCSRSNETFALQLAADALQKGLFGQTQQQLAVLFGELAMLQHRFVSGGLGEAPDLNLVMDAKSRLKDAALQSTLAGGKVAKALVHHFKKSCNLPLPGKETTIPTWNPISTLFQFFKI